jgi:hypothetical protein
MEDSALTVEFRPESPNMLSVERRPCPAVTIRQNMPWSRSCEKQRPDSEPLPVAAAEEGWSELTSSTPARCRFLRPLCASVSFMRSESAGLLLAMKQATSR